MKKIILLFIVSFIGQSLFSQTTTINVKFAYVYNLPKTNDTGSENYKSDVYIIVNETNSDENITSRIYTDFESGKIVVNKRFELATNFEKLQFDFFDDDGITDDVLMGSFTIDADDIKTGDLEYNFKGLPYRLINIEDSGFKFSIRYVLSSDLEK